jgi:hypothetical protein
MNVYRGPRRLDAGRAGVGDPIFPAGSGRSGTPVDARSPARIIISNRAGRATTEARLWMMVRSGSPIIPLRVEKHKEVC